MLVHPCLPLWYSDRTRTDKISFQLDEVFKKPELLATLIFSAFFVVCPNTDGNSLQFAKHVLLTYNPKAKSTEDLSKSMITLIATLVLTLVCLIHYFSRNSGLLLNKIFSIYKICFVFAFVIAGFHSANKYPGPGLKDWGERRADPKGSLTALVYVLYSYQGWENANYVGRPSFNSKSPRSWHMPSRLVASLRLIERRFETALT